MRQSQGLLCGMALQSCTKCLQTLPHFTAISLEHKRKFLKCLELMVSTGHAKGKF